MASCDSMRFAATRSHVVSRFVHAVLDPRRPADAEAEASPTVPVQKPAVCLFLAGRAAVFCLLWGGFYVESFGECKERGSPAKMEAL